MAIQVVQSTHNQEVIAHTNGLSVKFAQAVGAGNTLVAVVIGRKSPNPYNAGNTSDFVGSMDANTPAPVVTNGGTALSLAVSAVATPPVLTLSAAANAVGGATQYTGTITGGAANAFVGQTFTVAGFTTSANNGTFVCTASTALILTLANSGGVAETHAGTATDLDATYTIASGGGAALIGETFTVAGFAAHTSNNGTFVAVASTATTLVLANASALTETHAATAVTGGANGWNLVSTFKSIDAQTSAVSYSGGANFTVESLMDLGGDYPAVYVFEKSQGVLAGEIFKVNSAYLGPQNGANQDANSAAGLPIFRGGVNVVGVELSGTASPSTATAHHQLTTANPALAGATAGSSGNIAIAVGYMKNANTFAASSGWTVIYSDKCVASQDHFVVAYKIISGADQASFANPLGYKMAVTSVNLT